MGLKFFHGEVGAVVEVSGEDAATYLQSQFSNDLRRTEKCPVTYGLFLDRKGKTMADAFALQLGEASFLLVSYFCSSEALMAKLEENIIADDVELLDRTADFEYFCFLSDFSENVLQSLGATVPEQGEFAGLGKAYFWPGRRARTPHFDCLVEKESAESAELQKVKEKKEFEVYPLNTSDLEALRIADGIPAIPQDIGETDLPQEGELEADAVSFNKGCYLGQEVMARLDAMGQSQRKLFKVRVLETVETLPQSLYAGERKVGELRSVTPGETNLAGLALLKKRYVEKGSRLSNEADGECLVEII